MCTRYVICLWNNSHFKGLSVSLVCSSFWNTAPSIMRWLARSFKNDYIIQIDYTPVEVDVPEAGFHQLLKGHGDIGQSERYSIILIESPQPYCECSQWFAFLVHLHLQSEAISEMLLGLQIHHPSRVLELNLVEDPFQPHGKGGNLFITPMTFQLIKILHEDIKSGHHAKDDQEFVQYMVDNSGGSHIPSHICHRLLQLPDITFLNYCLQVVVLDAPDFLVPLLKRYLSLSRSGITIEGIDVGVPILRLAVSMLKSQLTSTAA